MTMISRPMSHTNPVEIPEPVQPFPEFNPAEPQPEAPYVPEGPGSVPDPGIPEYDPGPPQTEIPPLS